MDDRGQTLHDYVAGISVFILTVAVVLGLLPSVVAPFQGDGQAIETSQASRIGDYTVSNLSATTAPNVLDADNLTSVMAMNEPALRDRYGLPEYRHVNLSLLTPNGSRTLVGPGGTTLRAGAPAAPEDVRTAARIVQVSEPGFGCKPACRLVVRVW
jgi:hypothetical protein